MSLTSRFVWLLVAIATLYTLKLVDWNEGYDVGYDHAMAEAFIHPDAPTKRIKEIAGVK